MTAVVVERTSRLAAAPASVWSHATSMDGVNAELAPVRMTFPQERAVLPREPVLDAPLFTSTLKVGWIPFDRHVLRLVEVEPGRCFQEDSTSGLHRRWRHRRELTPLPGGCALHDRLEITPRLPGAGRLTAWLVGRIFDRRHRWLRERFGTLPAGGSV